MPGIKVATFLGMQPAKSDRLIGETVAAESENQKVQSGALDPLRVSDPVYTLANPTVEFVYRFPTGEPHILSQSNWVEFPNPLTDVVRSPLVNDSFDRVYWASIGGDLRYTTGALLRSTGPSAGLRVGVNNPNSTFYVSIVGGTGGAHNDAVELKLTRSYVLTYVTIYGEESAPTSPREAEGYADQTWRVHDIPQPPVDAERTEINKIRIYRTEVDASGGADYYRVAEINLGVATYDDTIRPTRVTANPTLDTIQSNTPAVMRGIGLLPNGVMVGHNNNNLYFSEPYKPHSWPVAYNLAVQHKIVGIAVFGSTCVVCTEGNPCLVTGISPATMTLTQLDISLPCVNRGGIVAAPEGVYYPSPVGLVLVNASGPRIVTEELINRDVWETDFNPSHMRGALYMGGYIGVRGLDGVGRFIFLLREGTITEVPVPSGTRIGMDDYSNKPWMISGGAVHDLFPVEGAYRTVRWKSKVFVLPNRIPLGAAQVYYDTGTGVAVTFKLWADGALVHTQTVTSTRPFRLPGGLKTDTWQFEITANTRVHQVLIGQTVNDLKSV